MYRDANPRDIFNSRKKRIANKKQCHINFLLEVQFLSDKNLMYSCLKSCAVCKILEFPALEYNYFFLVFVKCKAPASECVFGYVLKKPTVFIIWTGLRSLYKNINFWVPEGQHSEQTR